MRWLPILILLLLLNSLSVRAQDEYELDGSPFATANAPIPEYITPQGEKVIVVDPREHIYGAYNAKGKLIRWGLATGGSDVCSDTGGNCRTHTGTFRLYSLGSDACVSNKYPYPTGGASMPYCMYFHGGEAIHGSDDIEYDNVSHGCVRVHVSDAKWLRYHFVEGPMQANGFRGTKVIIKSY